MNDLGNDWIRLEFDFYSDDLPEKHELLVKLCRKNGIRVLGLITGGVPGNLINLFYPRAKFTPVTATQAEFQQYVRKMVTKYKGLIPKWEIWNEENSLRFWINKPNPQEYSNLLRTTYKTIKHIDPRAEVVMGGIMGDDHTKLAPFQVTEFVAKCLKADPSLSFDYLNYHPYLLDCYFSWRDISWYKDTLKQKIKNLVSYSTSMSQKQIIFSEFGISSKWVRLSSQEIAMVYKYVYDLCRAEKIDIFYWALFDSPVHSYEPGTPENGFGLLDKNLDPKPVFTYLKKII